MYITREDQFISIRRFKENTSYLIFHTCDLLLDVTTIKDGSEP